MIINMADGVMRIILLRSTSNEQEADGAIWSDGLEDILKECGQLLDATQQPTVLPTRHRPQITQEGLSVRHARCGRRMRAVSRDCFLSGESLVPHRR
jgi:hypothetical protein